MKMGHIGFHSTLSMEIGIVEIFVKIIAVPPLYFISLLRKLLCINIAHGSIQLWEKGLINLGLIGTNMRKQTSLLFRSDRV